MHFTPAETEKLLLSVAAMVARDRLERGILLNHPETVALLSCWVIERAREGRGVAELMQEGRTVLRRDQVMPGVPEMLADVQVEATFPDGGSSSPSTTRSTEDSPWHPLPRTALAPTGFNRGASSSTPIEAGRSASGSSS